MRAVSLNLPAPLNTLLSSQPGCIQVSLLLLAVAGLLAYRFRPSHPASRRRLFPRQHANGKLPH